MSDMLDHSTTHSQPHRPEEKPEKKKKKVWKIVLYVFISIFLFIILGIGILAFKFPLLTKAAYNFLTVPTNQVFSKDGTVNILLMGKSGGNRDGADLTDTMILLSLSVNGEGVETISIPRDIWVPEIMAKINSAYYWGKNGSAYFSIEETGGGIAFAKRMVGQITGQEIQYGVVVDFSAFEDIVNAIGGIEVNVENSFTDELYPIEGKENDTCDGDLTYACRYETVIFNTGTQEMDGETALKFVRSRHAQGDEGTDIAREARQQKVIEAIKNKILSLNSLSSFKTYSSIYSIFEKYVEANVDLPTAGILARLAYNDINNISQHSFPEDLLVNPPASAAYDNLYVFIPKAGNGNWEEIQMWFSSTLN